MNKTIISLLVLNILIALGGYAFPVVVDKLGAEGDTNLTNLVLSGTMAVTGASTHTGASTFSSLITYGSSSACATSSWNPGSIATSTITNSTSTDIVLSGSVMGDFCVGSLTSATSSAIRVKCDISGAATATISITNLGTTNAAIDLATGTAKVCYIR